MPNASIVFIDSNVLLCAASGRPADMAKSKHARALLERETVGISFQVLQEFYANAINPRKLNLSSAEATALCTTWMRFRVARLGLKTFVRTLDLAQRFQISNWDAAILAAAKQLGCATVYSEDLNDGQDYDGVRVENPFRGL